MFKAVPPIHGDGETRQPRASQLIRRISDEIRSSRSTQRVSIAQDQLLLGGVWANPLTIQSSGERFATDRDVQLNAVTPGFFATLGTGIVAGRGFDEHDSLTASEGGHRVVVVNEAFVTRYFGGRNPLGALVCMGSKTDGRPDIEIVGVVENISYRNVREQWEQAYFPMGADLTGSNFYVRVQGSPESAFQSIRAILRNADPTMPISYLRTLDEEVARSLNTERMLAVLSTSFSVLALLLSLVGLYGVMSFVVTRRRREIGIRLALGATRRSAVWLVLGAALLMVVAGTAIAVPGVWALGRLVESQLYDVAPTDPITIVAIALGAALVPAHRASIVNPTDALRFE
jgi:predicted permease